MPLFLATSWPRPLAPVQAHYGSDFWTPDGACHSHALQPAAEYSVHVHHSVCCGLQVWPLLASLACQISHPLHLDLQRLFFVCFVPSRSVHGCQAQARVGQSLKHRVGRCRHQRTRRPISPFSVTPARVSGPALNRSHVILHMQPLQPRSVNRPPLFPNGQ